MDHTRDPCPWVIASDFGGAFCMGVSLSHPSGPQTSLFPSALPTTLSPNSQPRESAALSGTPSKASATPPTANAASAPSPPSKPARPSSAVISVSGVVSSQHLTALSRGYDRRKTRTMRSSQGFSRGAVWRLGVGGSRRGTRRLGVGFCWQ